jgi:ATP phosphoribosyltransferase regulatory subunit
MTIDPAVRLCDAFAREGYEIVEPPILHDADLFLDLAGEDLRRRLFLTGAADGIELCLRPDYTIPVALHHLTTGDPQRKAAYAYCGRVFRQRGGETGEFRQAGVESIGRKDSADADADILALALKAVGMFGVDEPAIRIGDSRLFSALLDSLALPSVWRRRLSRAFGATDRVKAQLDELAGRTTRPRPALAERLEALQLADRDEAERAVETLLDEAGIPRVGGRSAAEIAERFLEQSALTVGDGDDRQAADVIERFLAIAGPPDEAAIALGELAAKEAPGLAAEIARFNKRTQALLARGIETEQMNFAADFGRRLDYYTGFVFELGSETPRNGKPIAGGGRYDRLLSLIRNRDGSGGDIPAVGFALWLDRLEAGAG